jgi:hypothetical protein
MVYVQNGTRALISPGWSRLCWAKVQSDPLLDWSRSRLVKMPNGPGPGSDWSGISGLSPDLSSFSMVPAWLVKVQNGSDPD